MLRLAIFGLSVGLGGIASTSIYRGPGEIGTGNRRQTERSLGFSQPVAPPEPCQAPAALTLPYPHDSTPNFPHPKFADYFLQPAHTHSMIRVYPKTAQAPTAISIAPLLPAFPQTEGMEGMSRYERGMERVWKRYVPTRKSLRIKYGGRQ
jgi:hypothetical protein